MQQTAARAPLVEPVDDAVVISAHRLPRTLQEVATGLKVSPAELQEAALWKFLRCGSELQRDVIAAFRLEKEDRQ